MAMFCKYRNVRSNVLLFYDMLDIKLKLKNISHNEDLTWWHEY